MENNAKEHGEKCCSTLCCGSWHKYHILRWLLGLIILVATFAIGYKIGEFKGYYQNDDFGKFHKQNYMYGRQGSFNKAYGPGAMNRGAVFFHEAPTPSAGAEPFPPMMFWQQTTSTIPQK